METPNFKIGGFHKIFCTDSPSFAAHSHNLFVYLIYIQRFSFRLCIHLKMTYAFR